MSTLHLHSDLTRLMTRQSGVIARHQLAELGEGPHDVRRRLRRREWAPLLPGVFVDHTGTPTWVQRAWAAVLCVWPAALAGESALRIEAGPGWRGLDEGAPVQVAVDVRRTVKAPDGVAVRRVADLETKVRWNLGPPRVRVEEATLDVAVAALPDVLATLEAIAGPVRARCTTPARLLEALDARQRVPHRRLVTDLLLDLRDGTCSALEHGYLTRVERPHGLPTPARQFHERTGGPHGRASVYRDAEYVAWRVTIELDGHAFHAGTDRHDRDLERDVGLAVAGRTALRLGWGQVFARPCRTAAAVARLLHERGWTGSITPCRSGCPAAVPVAA